MMIVRSLSAVFIVFSRLDLSAIVSWLRPVETQSNAVASFLLRTRTIRAEQLNDWDAGALNKNDIIV